MKESAMSGPILDVARTLGTRVRNFFDAPLGNGASPLELLHAALDELERKVQPTGRGSRVFPYTRVIVHVAQPGADRDAIEAVFAQLGARLRERLAEVRCDVPPALVASVSVAAAADDAAPVLRLECGNDGAATAEAPASTAALPVPVLRVKVVKGQCGLADYTVQGRAVAIGRGEAPSDTSGCVRRNDIAFLEVRDGITETVARAHARLEFDPALGAYVLFNESGSNPTYLLRGGRSLQVAPRDPRGVRVQPGDELQLGRAVLRIEAVEPTPL
jgi:hypothetical protein